MANICENKIVISIPEGNKELAADLMQSVEDKRLLNFLSPIEKGLEDSALVERQRQQWGTRCEVDIIHVAHDTDANGDLVVLDADSAWAPPLNALQDFKDRNPEVDVSCAYCEPSEFVGQWNNGADVHYDIPDTKEDMEVSIPASLSSQFPVLTERFEENEEDISPGM